MRGTWHCDCENCVLTLVRNFLAALQGAERCIGFGLTRPRAAGSNTFCSKDLVEIALLTSLDIVLHVEQEIHKCWLPSLTNSSVSLQRDKHACGGDSKLYSVLGVFLKSFVSSLLNGGWLGSTHLEPSMNLCAVGNSAFEIGISTQGDSIPSLDLFVAAVPHRHEI